MPRRRRLHLSIGVLTALSFALPVAQVASAPAASAVEPGSLGAAAASSWQTDATVWHMAYANGDIWMVGDFTTLRPPGAAAGTSTQPADYFAALKASTGAPDPAVNDTHSFTGQASGLPLTIGTVAASPDGSTIYVGGSFTKVDGVSRNHIAAFSSSNGALLPWNPNVSGKVSAIATNGDNVYIGGTFGKVGTTARTNLADVSASTGTLLSWAPTTNDTVTSMDVSSDGSQVVIGGYFTQVNGLSQSPDGTTAYNKAAILGGYGAASAGQAEPLPGDVVVPVNSSSCISNVKDIVVSGSAV